MDTALERRWESARKLACQPFAVLCDFENGELVFRVRSSSKQEGRYRVMVAFTGEQLVGAYCDCADFAETQLRSVPVCKHVLATCLYCRDKNLIEQAQALAMVVNQYQRQPA